MAQSNKIFKNWQGYRIVCIGKLEKQINYKFKNIALLEEAITHSSFQKNKLKIDKKNYERLEFLGDRVLGLVLSEYLLKIFPEAREGVLDNYFQKFANQDNLFNYAKKINLSKFFVWSINKRESRTTQSISLFKIFFFLSNSNLVKYFIPL